MANSNKINYIYDPVFLGVELSRQQPLAIFQGCVVRHGNPIGFNPSLAIVVHNRHYTWWRDVDYLRLAATEPDKLGGQYEYPIKLARTQPVRLDGGYLLVAAQHRVENGFYKAIYPKESHLLLCEAITGFDGLSNASLAGIIIEQLNQLPDLMGTIYPHVNKVIFKCPPKKTGNMVTDVGTIELTQHGMLQVLNRWISRTMSDRSSYAGAIQDLGVRLDVAGYVVDTIDIDSYACTMTVTMTQHCGVYKWQEQLLDPIFTEWLELHSGEDVVYLPDPLMSVLGEDAPDRKPFEHGSDKITVRTVEI